LPSAGAGVVRLVLSLLGAAVCAGLFTILALFAVDTARGQRIDQLVLSAGRGDSGPVRDLVFPALDVVSVPVVLVLLALGAVVALVRRRPGLLVHMVALVGGANLTTQVTKLLMDRTELADQVEATTNSFPSGHTTLAASVALALVLVVPPRARGPVGILGAAWTAAVGIGTIAQGWHRPSDVVGALLVCGMWTLLVLAADAVGYLVRRRRLARTRRTGDGAGAGTGTEPDPAADAEVTDRTGSPAGTARTPRHGLVAAVVLLVIGVAGIAAGLVQLAQIPTPLVLSDTSQQRSSYLAAIFAITGCSAMLCAAVLLLHTPDLRRYRTTAGQAPVRPVPPDAQAAA
jgi:membrane-associated phospholipid phosphatase